MHQRFALVGPGARSCIAALEGLPAFNLHSRSDSWFEFWNEFLQRWVKHWHKIVAGLRSFLPPEFGDVLNDFSKLDDSQVQFMLCELSKVLAWLWDERRIYERGYWETLFGDMH